MKNLLLIVFLFISALSVKAQETVQFNVVYEFTYVRDLENTDNPYQAIMVLSTGKNSSRYCTERLFVNNGPANS